MRHFLRLLGYSLKYRTPFLTGVLVSFFVAVLNGVSLTTFYPLFDALGDRGGGEPFVIQFSESERKLLTKAVAYSALHYIEAPEQARLLSGQVKLPDVPDAPEKIRKDLAERLLHYTRYDKDYGLNNTQQLNLRTMVRWKLKINEAAFDPLKVIYTALIVVFPLYLLKLIFHLISVQLIAKTGYKAVRDLRSDLYEAAQNLPLNYFYREKTGLLMSRMINDVEIVAAVISSNMRDSITNFFYLITHLFLLAYLNLELLIVSAVTLPLILAPVALFTRKISRSTRKSQELLADLNANLQEDIQGVRVIRSFVMEDQQAERFERVNQRLSWRSFKEQFYLKMGPNLVELSSALMMLAIIALGAAYLDGTNFTIGEFITFLMALMFIIRPIIQLASMVGKVAQASAAADRIFSIADRRPDITDPESPVTVPEVQKGITFENIQFTYPESDAQVIKGIDLDIPAGTTVALVGESGGGKSTLMDLLARFFDPDQGRILVDGVDIRNFALSDYRSHIGIVQQDTFLFHGSIRENIAYGSPEHDQSEVEKAARLAHAHDFITEMPEGYDTMVGERGVTLSGGQRQRISIARALLHDPEIMILDEATSALDTESERLVQDALERLFKNRTTFVIAHRLSTIEKADIIVVISHGTIEDMGRHEDLMERSGLYARLQQISREATEPESPADPDKGNS
ncbi:MAG: ABC transporter ATP-binding protein [Leptospiraceae bacterium]|nr:ABC transporter ATP-binding protein [Leptospiraceae bacterium]